MRRVQLSTALLAAACLAAGLTGPPASGVSAAAAPPWGPAQEVPPAGVVHSTPIAVSFPDGAVAAVWTSRDDDPRLEDPRRPVVRSTRPPGGVWGDPVTFPVDDAAVSAIAPRGDGSLEIAYWRSPGGEKPAQVRTWYADGSVGPVTLAGDDDFDLHADAEGDVVATRLGHYDEDDGFDRVVRYSDGATWQRVPALAADPRDVFRPGPEESVWMAGYDQDRSVLRVRRWSPTAGRWRVEWSRDYPSGHLRKPLVDGLDLAVGGTGRVVVAFQERAVGSTGDTVRSVVRRGAAGWDRPVVLQRLPVDSRRTTTAPVVAAAGRRALVAWTSSAPELLGVRQVRLARVTGRVDRVLESTSSFSGFRDLSLDLDLRTDGRLLVTYLGRADDLRRLIGWTGSFDELTRTTLIDDAGVMLGDAAFLGSTGAAVISSIRGGALVSRVQED